LDKYGWIKFIDFCEQRLDRIEKAEKEQGN
jgi:hypothetical protein